MIEVVGIILLALFGLFIILMISFLVVDTLDKQIPYKPQLYKDKYYICECGKKYEVDYEEYDWCPNCGQHLDRRSE